MTRYNIVGSNLGKFRVKAGLSQQKLAEALQRQGWDVSRDVIARIESHVRRVSDYEVLLLARGLGISIQDLIDASLAQSKLQEIADVLRSTRGRR